MALWVGDHVDAFMVDYRCPKMLQSFHVLHGQNYYNFCCDWSRTNEPLLITGSQDGTMRLWDNRKTTESVYCWNSALGSPIYELNKKALGGPVINCTLSHCGDYVIWAETLDHVGIVLVDDLVNGRPEKHLGLQSIDFIGK